MYVQMEGTVVNEISDEETAMNSLRLTYNLYASLHTYNVQKLSLVEPTMLIQVLFKYVLDLTCSALSTYFKRSQIYLLASKDLFSSRFFGSNRGTFSRWYSKPAKHIYSHYHLCLSC